MAGVQTSLGVLDRADLLEEWHAVLGRLAAAPVHGLLRGWCNRVLFEAGVLGHEELYTAARLALSPVVPPAEAAAWVQGLLRGSGQVLLHQDGVWRVLDEWLGGLDNETFVELLPLLRRAFADFEAAERRAMGEKVKHLRSAGAPTAAAAGRLAEEEVDRGRADRVLPVLAHILGVPVDGHR
jgi:hypothetical protein